MGERTVIGDAIAKKLFSSTSVPNLAIGAFCKVLSTSSLSVSSLQICR